MSDDGRRIVQMGVGGLIVVALCADGSLWRARLDGERRSPRYWEKLPPVPEPERPR